MMATATRSPAPGSGERSERLLPDGVSKRFGAVTALETMTLD
ncbi:hypothetical protein AWB69_02094 [Caballeronia udeis]|uniref:Uncharacterized protein n=1 Tax=Caballeronia udeis TaxID=1232866 RepID=A0A158G689_9BURK|nr:hypothetical protein [Caballeronia udeis]SAL27377.1 hypothetical protein AWB69_02094 [Caballeronia udeis]